jgi:hypothetical protein
MGISSSANNTSQDQLNSDVAIAIPSRKNIRCDTISFFKCFTNFITLLSSLYHLPLPFVLGRQSHHYDIEPQFRTIGGEEDSTFDGETSGFFIIFIVSTSYSLKVIWTLLFPPYSNGNMVDVTYTLRAHLIIGKDKFLCSKSLIFMNDHRF